MTTSSNNTHSGDCADNGSGKCDVTNIVIAGGGMVGISLALQLCAVLPEDISILLVESFPFPDTDKDPVKALEPIEYLGAIL